MFWSISLTSSTHLGVDHLLVSPFGKHVGIGLMFAEKSKYQVLLYAIYIINLP
jgi:hypothetical protein